MRRTGQEMRELSAGLFLVTIVFLVLGLTAPLSHAATVRVPADQPTIQAGIDAAGFEDTVLVASGLYTGIGNRDISFGGKGITLRSEAGPGLTIIDCQGLGRAFILRGSVTGEPTIEGFTIVNGEGGNQGGAIECFGFSPTIRYCVFASNHARYGGALYFNGKEGKSATEISSIPTTENCTFFGNTATAEGGVYFSNYGANTVFDRCLFLNNTSESGPVTEAGGHSSVTLNCSDLWANSPGDWIDQIEDQEGVNDNFSVYPVLCDPEDGYFGIHETSSLRPEISPCGQLVGAMGVGCDDCYDVDGDGLCAIDDNCLYHYNPDQLDTDSDGTGDVCEDDDNDGDVNADDNCPATANSGQADLDQDGIGDLCDDDIDGDDVLNGDDNCPETPNPGQEDHDGVPPGNACCCIGRIGDANGLGGDEPTVGDVSVMIDAKFIGGRCEGRIACLAEADINFSGGCGVTCNDITIGDISVLIDYLFITGSCLGLPYCLECP